MRSRKLDPQTLFTSVLHLATSTNREGYDCALQKTWVAQKKELYTAPVKSSLSEARNRVSYKFFEDIFKTAQSNTNQSRATCRGFYIYAVDGTDLDLPASPDIISHGFRGATWGSGELETYYPKMYSVQTYDLMNGIVRDFKFSHSRFELRMALDLVPTYEPNSIAIYDRLYCGHSLIAAHTKAGNYFLVRARDSDTRSARVVREFKASAKRETEAVWFEKASLGGGGLGVTVRLVKIWNPRTKKDAIFATNVPSNSFTRAEIGRLYERRWEIETSFKDLMHTFKMGQWHSTKLNGILQEVYSLLWFVNAVKMQMENLRHEVNDPLARDYYKSKFKLCADLVIRNLGLLIAGRISKLIDLLAFYMRRTKEKRRHRGRNYPRATHVSAQTYPLDNQVKRRRKIA